MQVQCGDLPGWQSKVFWRGGMYLTTMFGKHMEMKREAFVQFSGRHIDIAIRHPRSCAKTLPDLLASLLGCVWKSLDSFSSTQRLCLEVLSCHDLLRCHASGTQRFSYSIRDVCVAERERRTVQHRGDFEERPLDLLHAGVESLGLAQLKEKSHIMYLDQRCLDELNVILNRSVEDCGNWRNLASKLGFGKCIEIFGVRPGEATRRLMERKVLDQKPSMGDLAMLLGKDVKNTAARQVVMQCIERLGVGLWT